MDSLALKSMINKSFDKAEEKFTNLNNEYKLPKEFLDEHGNLIPDRTFAASVYLSKEIASEAIYNIILQLYQ